MKHIFVTSVDVADFLDWCEENMISPKSPILKMVKRAEDVTDSNEAWNGHGMSVVLSTQQSFSTGHYEVICKELYK